MIRDMVDFFRKERLYSILSLLLLAGFVFVKIFLVPQEGMLPESDALEEFRASEKRLQSQFRDAGSIARFAQENPEAGQLMTIFMTVAMLLFSCGLLLDLIFFFNPDLRARLANRLSPPGADWKLSMVFKAVVLFVCVNLVLGFLLSFINEYVVNEWSQNFFLLLQTTVADIALFFILVLMIRQAGGNWKDLGFRAGPGGYFAEFRAGLVAYVGVFPIFVLALFLLLILAGLLNYEPAPHPLVTVFLEEDQKSPFLIYYSILLATVIGPIFEEIFFRGFCYPIFKKRWGRGFALVLTSIFFAFVHNNEFAFFPIFALGMGLGYLYDKRESLIGPLTLHVLHNSLFIGYFFLAKQIVADA